MGSENGGAVCFSAGAKHDTSSDETISPFGKAFYKRQASFFVLPYWIVVIINFIVTSCSAAYWSIAAVVAAQVLWQIKLNLPFLRLLDEAWYNFAILYGIIASTFIIVFNLQAMFAMIWVIGTKWAIIGRRQPGSYNWNESSYCQRWQLHLSLSRPLHRGYFSGGVLSPLTGTAYLVWYFRALGASIGKNVSLFAGGHMGLMTEPDLVTIGNDSCLDDCSVVSHINTRGQFSLNHLKIGDGYVSPALMCRSFMG
jgi:hypothetical protein